jgi:hypothetical protein
MNQNDQDFEAAVIQLREGNIKNALKFGALLILTFIGFFSVTLFALSVGNFVKEFFGAG